MGPPRRNLQYSPVPSIRVQGESQEALARCGEFLHTLGIDRGRAEDQRQGRAQGVAVHEEGEAGGRSPGLEEEDEQDRQQVLHEEEELQEAHGGGIQVSGGAGEVAQPLPPLSLSKVGARGRRSQLESRRRRRLKGIHSYRKLHRVEGMKQ